MYTREYYSGIKGNAFQSVLMRWMNIEPIIQNEVNQKEKEKYCVLTYIYGIQKDGINESIRRAAMEMQTQRTDLRARVGEKRERMRLTEISMDAYTVTYVNREPMGICSMIQGTQTGALQ